MKSWSSPSFAVLVGVASTLALATGAPSTAHACGACFVTPNSPTVVSGHRMVMSISREQTVLWDQIQYQGEPEDFAWVLPVKPGARIEEATDAFFEALEATTQTVVSGQTVNCAPGFNEDGGYYDGDGCSAGCGDDAASGDGEYADGSGGTSGGPPPNPVEVVHQGSVGPYETVTLSTMTPGALNTWLTQHGYNVDAASQPIIDQYVAEGFDFIALRLAPGLGVKQMKPVRVVMEGGGLTLPLRMVAIGTGAQTPIILYLIGEGRYAIENLAEVTVPIAELTWDYATKSSNYEPLRIAALTQNAGASFLTSFATPTPFTDPVFTTAGPSTRFIELYEQQAKLNGEAETTCDIDPVFGNGSAVVNPCPPGEPLDSAACTDVANGIDARVYGCDGAYDVSAALIGMHPLDVWVARTEMILPREALTADLRLKTAPQTPVTNKPVAPKSLNEDKACDDFSSAVAPWQRLKPPSSPLRAPQVWIGTAALALVMRRLLRGKRWSRPVPVG